VHCESQDNGNESSDDAYAHNDYDESNVTRPSPLENRMGVDMQLQLQNLEKSITFEGVLVVPAAVRSALDMLCRAS